MRVRLLSSSVRVPFQPGSQKPAVAWTISPRRPILDLPSIRATMSSGNSTHSRVRPRQNSPGWMTNDSCAWMVTSSVRPDGGSRRSIAEARWLWKTRNESPRRRSTLAGWTRFASQGSIRIRPVSTSSRIVASDRTEASALIAVAEVVTDWGLALDGAGARPDGPHARGGQRRRIAVRSAARMARELLARMPGVAPDAAVVVRRRLVRLRLDGPPDDVDQPSQGDLQGKHQPDESPGHVGCDP